MALLIHSGLAATQLSTATRNTVSTSYSGTDYGYAHSTLDWLYEGDDNVQRWNVSDYDASWMRIGQTLQVGRQWWQVVAISGHVVTVTRAEEWQGARSLTEEMPTPPPPATPPIGLEPPPWPMTPPADTPTPIVPLEIPERVGMLLDDLDAGRKFDPITHQTAAELAAWEEWKSSALQLPAPTEQVAVSAPRRRWFPWRKAS